MWRTDYVQEQSKDENFKQPLKLYQVIMAELKAQLQTVYICTHM